jgi:uncharacterized membrane protein YbhN (UPF0104 family)
MVARDDATEVPRRADLKRQLVRGGIVLALLVVVAIGVVALLPGLSGVRSAIAGASGGWVAAGAGIQLVGIAGAVVFVQLVFADVPHRLTWRMGGAQEAANAVMPTAGSTAVSYWTLTSIGWRLERFAERTAVMIIAPAAPNVLLIIVVGLGMWVGLLAGPQDWWLTILPVAVCIVIVVVAILAARWGQRLAERTHRRWLREGLHIAAIGVTGTVDVLRRRSWRVLGTWVDLLGSIGALWACLIAVGDHLPFAVVAMGYLIGQVAQIIPVPGGIGTIDAGVTGALVIYGGDASISGAAELISHALALLLPILVGTIAFLLLPREIDRTQHLAASSPNAP